jgi:hypothetical protein
VEIFFSQNVVVFHVSVEMCYEAFGFMIQAISVSVLEEERSSSPGTFELI